MRYALACLLIALGLACGAQRPIPGVSPVAPVRVSIGAWDSYHREQIGDALRALRRAGVPVVVLPSGAPVDATIEHGDLDRCTLGGRPGNANTADCPCEYAGRYVPERQLVELDPACIPAGALGFRHTVQHEVLHAWLYDRGGRHVCREPGELDYRHEACSPGGYGPAVMNPAVLYRHGRRGDAENAATPPTVVESLTDLDRAEIARVLGGPHGAAR